MRVEGEAQRGGRRMPTARCMTAVGANGTCTGRREEGRQERGARTYRVANGDVYEGEYKADKKEGGAARIVGDCQRRRLRGRVDGEVEKEGRGTYRRDCQGGNVHEGEFKARVQSGYERGARHVSYKAGQAGSAT